jgi:hypothetical protein
MSPGVAAGRVRPTGPVTGGTQRGSNPNRRWERRPLVKPIFMGSLFINDFSLTSD